MSYMKRIAVGRKQGDGHGEGVGTRRESLERRHWTRIMRGDFEVRMN